MISRRLLITGFAAAAASTIAPAVMAAGDGGFGDFLGGLADAASRRYAEKYRDDARWDGKYYYDKYDNRRYSRSEWQREIQRRTRAEEEGRDWRDSKRRAWEEKRYGKDYRKFNKEQRRDERRDVKDKRREEERERKERERMRKDAERVRRNDERVRRNDERIRREDERRRQEERRRDNR